ncbi:alpha-2-macroglobulin family protein [Campylobacter hominis]|uniref:Alpha-2-macroglobulin family N-region n=1 Tax=Campylobacter hominis (strain ATCC BAA-381 / DSM 21671 / CCUG 45161 / LMG 19568 / NCTC 13146 / CH001A) TaxID=360107 RepID=A7I2N9_CAMHC|nr:alpha-2-macroglobulin family protein [Campylobacter hominis]ABS52163.1 alpha-2-macroglobulin family N- region [Campylobacter hominis ATCC BAA-381]UAK85973.1 hypothetical protein K8O82_00805 [Campylobacter hominis]SUW85299.1 alpha-2-macroglobulin family protein [Campylobacter hominis]
MKKLTLFLLLFSYAFADLDVKSLNLNEEILKIELSLKHNKTGEISKSQILKCEPKINGTYEFIKDNEINFYPANGFIKGQTYKCENQSFKTEDFKITNAKNLNNEMILLNFNDFISPEEIKKNLKLFTKEKLSKNNENFEILSDDNRTFFIKHDKKLQNLELEISKNLKSIYGISLDENFNFNVNNSEFIDNKSAINTEPNKIIPKAFNHGKIGFSVLFDDYIEASARFVKIDGISHINIKNNGCFYDNDKYNCKIDILSNELEPNKTYKITLLKGFGDKYHILRKDFTASLKTPNRAIFIDFSDDKNIFSKNATLSFKSANINEIKILVSKIKDQNFRYFLNFNDYAGNFVSEVFSEKFSLKSAQNEISEHKIDLSLEKFPDGVYKFEIFYKDEKDKLKSVTKIAYISDITAAFLQTENSFSVLTSRISNGEILKNADLEIYSDKNELLFEGKSDQNGIFKIDEDNVKGKKIKSIVVKKGGETGFLIIKNSINNVYNQSDIKTKSFLYFASELIKPNENVNAIFFLKDNELNAVKNVPVNIKIFDPSGNEIINKNAKTDDFGTVFIDEKMGEKGGFYKLEVIFENRVLQNKSFSVESFVPNDIKGEILSKKDEYFKGENIELKLIANYLFGAPAANLNATLNYSVFEKEFKDKNYENFSFLNETIYKKTAFKTGYEDFLLGNDAENSVLIPTNFDTKISNVAQIRADFNVFGGNKNSRKYKDFTFFPYKYLTAIKADKTFISEHESVNFEILSLNAKDKKPVNRQLDIEIYKINYDYIFDGGKFEEQNEFVLQDSFKTDKSFDYKFENGGNYIIVANDYLSGSSASVNVDVGGFYYYARLNKNDLLSANIKLEKDSFLPGETIKGVINSKITDGILNIALVDDKISDFKILKIKNNSSEFSLKVPENFKGGFINAVIFQSGKNSTEPIRTYANIPVKLEISSKKIPLTLEHIKTAKNGEEIEVSAKTSPNSKVTLFVVDEGILEILNKKELEIFNYFNMPKWFYFAYFDAFDDISRYDKQNLKTLKFGGDGIMLSKMMDAAKQDTSPVKDRKERSFIKTFSAISDKTGIAKFNVKFPQNFNSKVRITAISTNDEGINSTNSYIQIKDNIVLKVAALDYLVKNDEINFPINIINTTNENKNLILNLKLSKNLKTEKNDFNISVKALENLNFKIPLKALDLGIVNINFTLFDGKEKFSRNLNFDIISQYPKSYFYEAKYTQKALKFRLDESYGDLSVSLSNAPDSEILAQKLSQYPYFCTEQVSSKLVAFDFLYEKNKENEILKQLRDYVSILLYRLKDDGSFAYWGFYSEPNEFYSIYASNILLELNKKYSLIGNFQKKLIFKNLRDRKENLDNKIYAYFVLNRFDKLENSEINEILDKRKNIKNFASKLMLAEILKTNNLKTEFEILRNEIKISEAMSNRDKISALYLNEKTEIFTKNNIKEILSNLETPRNTFETALLIRALKDYKDDDIKKAGLKINNEILEKNVPFRKIFTLKDRNIEILPQNEVFYTLFSAGYAKKPLKHDFCDFEKNECVNIDIFREFVDQNGKKIDLNKLKIGDIIFSKIDISSPNNFDAGNIIVDEGVSSCFEIVNENIYPQTRSKKTQDSIKFSNKEFKADRIISANDGFYGHATFYSPLKVILNGHCSLPAASIFSVNDENMSDYDLEFENFTIK